ncbi:MAG: adenylate/guanylate cyclase domain-containing protein [Ignavibacteria bacterium]
MNRRSRNFLRNLSFNLTFCVLAGVLFVIFRFFGTFDFENPGTPISSLHLMHAFLEGFAVGILNGFSITVIDLLVDTERFKRRSFRYTIIFKSLAYCFSIAISVVLIFGLNDLLMGKQEIPVKIDSDTGNRITRMYIIAVFTYIICMNVLLNLFKEADKKFGPGVMLKLFSGRYYHPVIEERIFMFLDLKSSTSIAERLGHIKYSRLVQDCFYDVTDIVEKYHAEIYQYVGDEIVLTWETEKGIENENCIWFFFEFQKKLAKNSERYTEYYNVVPEFKAGINCGSVTVCEIGEIKKDIAYHGDVLNTASRIQGLCNTYNKEVLISEMLNKKVPKEKFFKRELIGEILLRGKEAPVGVYSLEIPKSN